MDLKQHLKDRHFDTSLHAAWIDQEKGVVTFPLWNLSGSLRGFQQYRPSGNKEKFNNTEEGRYYTYRTKMNPERRKSCEIGVWGLETFYWSKPIFVFEGIFDASRLSERGYSVLAVCANDPDRTTIEWLYLIRAQRPVIVVCDGDKAGHRLAKNGTHYHVMPGGMDMGDVSDEYVTEFLENYK